MIEMLKEMYKDISLTKTLNEYNSIVDKYVLLLEKNKYFEIVNDIKVLSKVQVNKFSKVATNDSFQSNKNKLLSFLRMHFDDKCLINKNSANEIVDKILNNFSLYCRQLYKKNIHRKCNSTILEHLPCINIQNEYDIQQLMYPLILSVFESAKIEENQDTGHHTVRKDIVIDEYDIVIELKCTRSTMTERQLSDEIAADMIHYENKNIYFYVYDKMNIINNSLNFKKTYENKIVDGKTVHIVIVQSL